IFFLTGVPRQGGQNAYVNFPSTLHSTIFRFPHLQQLQKTGATRTGTHQCETQRRTESGWDSCARIPSSVKHA
ncbi:hypothetical protein X975_10161, partial [Stegodyphus mimosarum]